MAILVTDPKKASAGLSKIRSMFPAREKLNKRSKSNLQSKEQRETREEKS